MPEQTVATAYETLRESSADPQIAALVFESEIEPVAGAGAVIQPPTYLAETGSSPYAESNGFVPVAGTDGWHDALVRDEAGRPLSAPSVVIDAVGSQANRCEEALWSARDLVGGLPGIEVVGTDITDEEIEQILATHKISTDVPVAAEIRDLLSQASVSSWTASHRHVDAFIRYAKENGTDGTAWTQPGRLRELIAGINTTTDATTAYQYAVNAIIFGFWLASGVVQRHRQARIYSSEIVGYNVHAAAAGASKVSDLPASNKLEVTLTDDGFTSTPKNRDAGAKKPSNFGFGMVPNAADRRGFVCEKILRRGSVSFSALRSVRYGDRGAEVNQAAAVVVASLSALGHHLSALDTHLRSGCDLVTVESRVGLRKLGQRGTRTLVRFPSSTEELAELARLSIEKAADVGLRFEEPLVARMSAPEVEQVVLSAALGLKTDGKV